MVPMFIIIVIFLVVFFLTCWQYFKIDPKRRVVNARFAMMAGALIIDISYPIYNFLSPGNRPASWLLLAVGLFLLALTSYMLRTMPPRDVY